MVFLQITIFRKLSSTQYSFPEDLASRLIKKCSKRNTTFALFPNFGLVFLNLPSFLCPAFGLDSRCLCLPAEQPGFPNKWLGLSASVLASGLSSCLSKGEKLTHRERCSIIEGSTPIYGGVNLKKFQQNLFLSSFNLVKLPTNPISKMLFIIVNG